MQNQLLYRERNHIGEYIVSQFMNNIIQHSNCYISYSFFFLLIKRNPILLKHVDLEKLKKINNKALQHFEEAGQVRFIDQLNYEQTHDWVKPGENLEIFLIKKKKPNKVREQHEESIISQTKIAIPPLILPSSKSLNSERYSAISRQQRIKGINDLRSLANQVGEGFIAVELGCLLAYKRTQQVHQFTDNSETERNLSSRMQLADKNCFDHKNNKRQFEQTNRKYYRRVMIVNANISVLKLEEELHNCKYEEGNIIDFLCFFLKISITGVIEPFEKQNQHSNQYFCQMKLKMLSISKIMGKLMERISLITEKRHLCLLNNRNKKNSAFHFKQQPTSHQIKNGIFLEGISLVKHQHLKIMKGPAKNNPETQKHSDFVLNYLSMKLHALFSQCDMGNSKFYKYQGNLLGILAFYLSNSYSSTANYLALDMFFPFLIQIKRQILELSHPYLNNYQETKDETPSRFTKKNHKRSKDRKEKIDMPLIVTYPKIMSNFLMIIANLMSNHKYVERLISTTFIKNTCFTEILQFYVKFIFEKKMKEEIINILYFYRKCLEIYNQRKLRNQQSKSIKTIFNHISIYFCPKYGCIPYILKEYQYLISPSPENSQQMLQQHNFLHEILQFIKDVFYFAHNELSEILLDVEVTAFYIKFSLINFIKLYSSLTVNELINLQNEKYELTTKESPHVSFYPSVNTIYMIDFVRILTSISINRTCEISKKIRQYRILEFFVRQFELEFCVKQNIQKFIKKVAKVKEVPQVKPKQPKPQKSSKKSSKIPPLNLKSQCYKVNKTSQDEEQKVNKTTKNKSKVPSLKLPSKTESSNEGKGFGDEGNRNKVPNTSDFFLPLSNLALGERSNDQNNNEKSSQRNLIYNQQRKIRKIYSNKVLHSESMILVLSLLLYKGLLDPEYCDQFPINKGKINVLYILHFHLNEQTNKSIIPIIAESVSKIKPYLSGQRLLKLLCKDFTDLSHYNNWQKISAGAYGVIYGCMTNIEEPKEVAIKQMNFPKTIYGRCVLHDIFTEISCLENYRLDDRITTMFNYGVTQNSYVIVMKKYDISLKGWLQQNKEILHTKFRVLMKIYWDIMQIIHLLHQQKQMVTHYDIKADNILLLFENQSQDPTKVVLGDFGQCKIFSNTEDQLDMKPRGTECIKSPQMLTLEFHSKKQSDNYDRRKKIGTTRASDIWSLGCLFYQLLTGEYLFHRSDWGKFYVYVTSTKEQIINQSLLENLAKYGQNIQEIVQFLRIVLVRDPKHRPQIKGLIIKFTDLFGKTPETRRIKQSSIVLSKDLQNLVNQYIEQILEEQSKMRKSKRSFSSNYYQEEESEQFQQNNKLQKIMYSYNKSKSNKFMRIMEDIYFCESIAFNEQSQNKMKNLRITHVVTSKLHPQLEKLCVAQIKYGKQEDKSLTFRLAPYISDILRQVLLLKGKLLFINDQSNYATNLLIYTLSYWFRCSVYETWCLINTQILLFPTFTSDLIKMSSTLNILNEIEYKVEEFPKLQCICGSVTIILKEINKLKKKCDYLCKCKKKKINQHNSQGSGDCPSLGCSAYLEFIQKRYNIIWDSLKWSLVPLSSLLTTVTKSCKKSFIVENNRQSLKTQIFLNSSEPFYNMIEIGASIKGFKVYSCKVCQMMMMATSDHKEEVFLIMNNMLRRIRQGIMIPNVQQNFTKRTPALNFYTLTKLHLTSQ